MPDFKEILTQNADAFKDIEGVDTTIDTVSAKLKELGYGLIIDNVKEPGFVPKSRLDEVVGQKHQFKTQADELAKQLEELKKAAKGNEDLTKQIEELQKQNVDWQAKYQGTALESAVKFAAVKEKARDAGDVLPFIDKSKLKLGDDGTVSGLDEQLKGLKESKPYLFDNGKPVVPPNPGNPSHQPTGAIYTKDQLGKMSPADINANWDAIQKQLAAGQVK